jgi:peptidoglycan/xylan/chitin deacetylase (PgdA/CDA1 family)
VDLGYREELARQAAESLERSNHPDAHAAAAALRWLASADEPPTPAERKELERQAKKLARADVAELRAAGRALRARCAELAPSTPSAAAARVLRLPRPNGPFPWRRALVVVGVVALLASALAVASRAAAPDLAAAGPEQGALIGRADLATLTFSSATTGAEWLLDGRSLRPQTRDGRSVFRPGKLADGEHELVIRRSGRLFASTTRTFRFVVDTTSPKLVAHGPAVVSVGKPFVFRGKLEPGARLQFARKGVPVDERGAFVLRPDSVPRRMNLLAIDAAGNASRWRVPVTVVPRRPAEPVRAVHVTAYGWANDELREGVMALVRAKKINAIELDLKDESGEVGWPSRVPLARRIGAQLEIYDLEKTVEELHALGVRVIGRLVCFRDPIHAQAAWAAGRRNEVVQDASGGLYGGYGGFTNFAHPVVRKYNIDLAVAAAKLGVDEILYDYVRRPDGPTSSMRFPGLKGTPERAIVSFLAESRAALASTEALVGASVFGVAATRPEEVAQDIPKMARHVDYIAPMLYPSHWGPGEYGVADPNGQPYEIVLASTKDFVKQVRGTGARIVNWLQDFSYGRTYGPEEVRMQIKASRAAGVDEFLLWDAAVTYTADGLEPTAALPALGMATEPPKNAPLPVRLLDPKPAAEPQPAPATAANRPLPGLAPNELGQIPVVMHHMIRPDRVGEYDQTPAEFRAELRYLWRNGYVPVNAGDVAAGRLDVPKGTTPVAFTFDDATTYQLDFTPDGQLKPNTAVGIMLEFAKSHPGFVPKGTFFVNRTPFGSDANAKRALKWLTANGFELGNHTHDHVPLRTLSRGEVQKQVATGADVIRQYLPGYRVRTLSLPLGALPLNAQLAVRGIWEGKSYGPYAVLLVGANPAPSPYAKSFDAAAIPRIRTSHAGWNGEADFSFSYWMTEFERTPRARYVSDGDPQVITVRKGAEADVRQRYAARVRVAP